VGVIHNERLFLTVGLFTVEAAPNVAGFLVVGESDKGDSSTHPSDGVGEDLARDELSKETKVVEQVNDGPTLWDSRDVQVSFLGGCFSRSGQGDFEELVGNFASVQVVGCFDCFFRSAELGEGVSFSKAGVDVVDHSEIVHSPFGHTELVKVAVGHLIGDVVDHDLPRNFLGLLSWEDEVTHSDVRREFNGTRKRD